MNIRPATASKNDLEAIKRLSHELDVVEQANQPEHFTIVPRTDEMLLKYIETPTADYLLAEENGEIVGFMLVEEQEIGAHSGLIPHKFAYAYELIVSPAAQKGGYGKALLQAAKDWAKAHGMPYFKLSVLPENAAALEFYVRNGMETVLINMECKI